MLTLGAIAVGIMVVILLLLFGVRWRLLPLFVILVGVTWAFGLAGYLGIPLSVVTIAGLPVMLGVGIDYAIQMHSRIEEVVIDQAEHPIQEAAVNLGPALLVVAFDAIFAFLALRFAKVPMIRDFGLLLAVGIAAICVCSIVLPIAILGIREYRSPTKGRDFSHGTLAKLVVWLGALPSRLAVPLAIASVVIFVGGIVVEDQLDIQSDPEEWVNQDTQVIKDIDTLNETGSSAELGIFIESDDVFSDETVAFVTDFANEELAQRPEELLTASSMPTTVSFLLEVPDTTLLPPGASTWSGPTKWRRPTSRKQRSTRTPTPSTWCSAPGPARSTSGRCTSTRSATSWSRARPQAAWSSPRACGPRRPAWPWWAWACWRTSSRTASCSPTWPSCSSSCSCRVRLRSVVRALLSMVPVLIAVGAASLVAWVLNLQLSPMTAVGGPLVVALCTEFTSLILLRFIEERHRGHPPKEAVEVTASRTGRAFIVSALTAISGVAVIALSSLPLLRDFGAIVAMNVTVALLSALVFLPPMLVWAEERGWVTRGLRKPPPIGGPTPTSAPLPTPAPEHAPEPTPEPVWAGNPTARTKPDLDSGHDRRMTDDVLGDRALGRATLARQILLEREDRDLTATVDHLVGLQAQVPHNPYTALWSRLDAVRPPGALPPAVRAGSRTHRHPARDPPPGHRGRCPPAAPAGPAGPRRRARSPPDLRPVARRASTSTRSWPSPSHCWTSSLAPAPSSGRSWPSACPSTTPPPSRSPAGTAWRWSRSRPGGCGAAAARSRRPRPRRGSAGRSKPSRPSTPPSCATWPPSGRPTVADVATWSRLTGFREVLDRLRPQLRTFRDERGRELFDLQGAPSARPRHPGPRPLPARVRQRAAQPRRPIPVPAVGGPGPDRRPVRRAGPGLGALGRHGAGGVAPRPGAPRGDRPSSPCARSGS